MFAKDAVADRPERLGMAQRIKHILAGMSLLHLQYSITVYT